MRAGRGARRVVGVAIHVAAVRAVVGAESERSIAGPALSQRRTGNRGSEPVDHVVNRAHELTHVIGLD